MKPRAKSELSLSHSGFPELTNNELIFICDEDGYLCIDTGYNDELRKTAMVAVTEIEKPGPDSAVLCRYLCPEGRERNQFFS